MPAASAIPAEQDPFLFDSEQLHAIADPSVIRRGLAHFKDGRVTTQDSDDSRMWASVEDEDSEAVLNTELSYDGDGNLLVACECGDEEHVVCRHAVAALYAYAAQRNGTDRLLGAVDSALDERIQRGRTEVRVEHLGGDPWFGTWRAASIASSSHFPRIYQIAPQCSAYNREAV